MDRLKLEALLLDPASAKKLTERADLLRQRFGCAGHHESASRVRHVIDLQEGSYPTPDEAARNDRNYVIRTSSNSAVTRFLTHAKGTDPAAALRLTIQMCRESSSSANRLYVELTLNQLLAERELSEREHHLVTAALELLHAGDGPKPPAAGTTDEYNHADLRKP